MPDIFTAGYEGLTPQRFFDLLHRCGIDTVADVRELPISRKKGFSKSALSEQCRDAGLQYFHLPEVGCPRHIRHEYRETGDWKVYTIRFKSHLSKQTAAIAQLADLAESQATCLLCFEEDFNFCHRTYVAEAVANQLPQSRICHLTGPIQGRVVVSRGAAAA